MTSEGRDGPCPCGSGRRHKDCCGKVVQAAPELLAAAGTRDSSLAKLLTFAFQPAFDSDHSVAEIVFWGKLIRDGAATELQWLLDSEDANIKYNAWFLFDWEVDSSSTVAELFLEEADAKLVAAERQFLQRMCEAHLRLYEVESVDRGNGVRLIDLWSGARLFVIERTATLQIVTWDLLGARVAPDGLGGNVFEGGLYLYPAEVKDQVVGHFRRLFRRHHRRFPMEESGTFFRKHGMVFHHLWLNLVTFPEPPQVVTSDGDPLVFCRSVFDTDDPGAMRAAISSQPDIRAIDGDHLSWREVSAEGERELGTWSFEANRVQFETTSQERAARGRSWLEALAGERVRYRATSLETLEHTMNELRRHRPRRTLLTDEPPHQETGAVTELFDRHYQSWLERPVPALGNRTPRHAARTKLWRPRLVELLKQLENSTERAALHGRPPYDFRWIWRELGIERPGSA